MQKYIKDVFLFSFIFMLCDCERVHTKVDFELQCEHLFNPLGVSLDSVRFNWSLPDEVGIGDDSVCVFLSEKKEAVECFEQSALYKTLAPLSVSTLYEKPDLMPGVTYFWCLKTGHFVSEIASFTTAFSLDGASWISDGKDCNDKSSSYYKKIVYVKPGLSHAYIVLASAGLHEIRVNNEKIGSHCLDPMFTRFDKRILSVTHEITTTLREGENEVKVQLGNGWYNLQSVAVWNFDKAAWRGRPAFLSKLILEYEDGTRDEVVTDDSWTTADSPIVFNSIYTAEHYDARKKAENLSGKPVKVTDSPTKLICSQMVQPIRVTDTIFCSRMDKLNDSLYVFTFPKNIAGVTCLNLKGKEGTVVRLKHGELLNESGTVNTGNIDYHYRPIDGSDPFQEDIVILSGTQDTFSPKFNYKGFQYVEVSASSPIVLTKNNLVAWEMHSDVPVKGTWHSSSDMLNRLWRATNRSYLSNLFGYPTDCPQREKNGWTGDAHLAMEVGLFNYDVITIYEKWMNDFIDEQRPDGMLPAIIPTSGWGYDWGNGVDWTSSIVIIPWLIYRYYGDDILLRRMYVPMKHFMECVEEKSDDYLTDWGLGDWIPVKSQSNVELVVSIYYYVDANIMSLIAERMGLENDKVYYESLAGKIKNAINQKYLSKCDGLYASGTQTELAMPLYWGVVPDSLRSKVAENLNKRVINDGYHLDVGVHGCKTLLGALSDNGFIDTAYKVVTQTTYPSWGYWIAQGATTLHENWRTDVIIDNSLNHIMFGEVGAWLYKSLAGIRLDENQPAFRKTHIKPYFPKDLECLDVSYKTSYGKLQLEWQKKGKEVIYHLHVPAAMEVVLTSPAGDVDNYGGGDYVFKWNVNYD